MNKPEIDARALVAKLSQRISTTLLQQEIVAPLLPHGRIRTRVENLIYEFQPQGDFIGWGLFQPINEQEAQWVGEALPWQRALYLEQFPVLRLILLWPVGESDAQSKSWARKMQRARVWLALPYNASDAQQRFGLEGNEPLQVFLCDALNGAASFERILARVDSKTIWYDGPDTLSNPVEAEWLRDELATFQHSGKEPSQFMTGLTDSQRLALLFGQIHLLETQAMHEAQTDLQESGLANPSETESHLEQPNITEKPLPGSRKPKGRLYQRMLRARFEQRLHRALSKADAVLHNYTETNNQNGKDSAVVVEWSEKGQTYRYRTLIDRKDDNFTVVSSGICLSGRDSDFDLTSLVSVMRGGNDYD